MDTKAIAMDYDIVDFGEQLVPVTVRLPENVYFQTKELAEIFSLSFASVARITLEANLENYLGTVKYIDKEQADKISEAVRELTDECREIKNHIKRIGINYNQEIRLKNITQKYHDVLNDKTASEHRRLEARKEYEDAVKSIDDTCLNKTELKELLERFEAAADKAEELAWLIHQ